MIFITKKKLNNLLDTAYESGYVKGWVNAEKEKIRATKNISKESIKDTIKEYREWNKNNKEGF